MQVTVAPGDVTEQVPVFVVEPFVATMEYATAGMKETAPVTDLALLDDVQFTSTVSAVCAMIDKVPELLLLAKIPRVPTVGLVEAATPKG